MEEYLKEPLKFTNDPSITAKKIAVSNENSGQNSKIEEEKKEDVKGVSQKEIEEEEAPLEPIVVINTPSFYTFLFRAFILLTPPDLLLSSFSLSPPSSSPPPPLPLPSPPSSSPPLFSFVFPFLL